VKAYSAIGISWHSCFPTKYREIAALILEPVTWAQRSSSSDADRNIVFLTLMVPDVPKDKCKIDLQSNKLTFTGESTSKKVTYHLDIELFAEVDPQESKISHTDANVAMVLRKKELKEEFWPRLLKDSKKQHYLKTDFDKVCHAHNGT